MTFGVGCWWFVVSLFAIDFSKVKVIPINYGARDFVDGVSMCCENFSNDVVNNEACKLNVRFRIITFGFRCNLKHACFRN